MGTLYYGSARTPIAIEDRELSHLKVVITSKLRRNEPLLISWTEPVESGSGRGSIWVHTGCDLFYRFDGSRSPELDGQLLDQMAQASSSSRGLIVGGSTSRPAVTAPVQMVSA